MSYEISFKYTNLANFLFKKIGYKFSPVYNQWYYYSHAHFGEHPVYNHEANRGGVDEGSEMCGFDASFLSARTIYHPERSIGILNTTR